MQVHMLFLLLCVLNTFLVGSAVLVHYETLNHLSKRLPRITIQPRAKVLVGVFTILAAHVVEIWLFAGGYYGMLHIEGMGTLTGNMEKISLLECSYFSFVTFT